MTISEHNRFSQTESALRRGFYQTGKQTYAARSCGLAIPGKVVEKTDAMVCAAARVKFRGIVQSENARLLDYAELPEDGNSRSLGRAKAEFPYRVSGGSTS